MSGSSDEDLVIRVKEVETELANLRSVVSNGQPVCPYCMAPMRPTNYSVNSARLASLTRIITSTLAQLILSTHWYIS